MDKVLKSVRSNNMRQIKSRNTTPEISVRKLVYKLGFRYRLHRADLPGKPDLVFINRKKLIFVHGCYWHQHSAKQCKKTHIPKSNIGYWLPKLRSNVERDKRNIKVLKGDGWDSLVIWECQTYDAIELESKLNRFLNG